MRASTVTRGVMTAFFLLLAAPAFAQQRVTVENFPKDKRGAVRAQLAATLCPQTECVPPSRVQTRKKLDWKKVQRERLAAVLSGAVVGKGPKTKLSLTLVDANKRIVWRKPLRIVRGKLVPRELGSAVQEILSSLALAPPPPPPSDTPTENPMRPPPPPDENRPFFSDNSAPDGGTGTNPPPVGEGTPSSEPSTATGGEQDAGEPASVTVEEAKLPEANPRVQPIIVAELGADVLFRNFGYQDLQTPNLFGYRATGIVMPSLHAELYPLAPFVRGLAAGIGLTGDVAFAVGLKSSLEDGTQFPTRVLRWGFGLKWAIRPIAGSGFNFGPEIGYRVWEFEVQPGENGVTIPELPGIAYRGMDVALGLEVPLGNVATFSARGAYLPVFSAPSLLSESFFPAGHASGFSGEASLGFYVGLGQLLEVRLTGLFTQYTMTFTDVDPSATFRAAGSTDRYFGGKLGLRVRW